MSAPLDLRRVSRTLEAFLERRGRPILLQDEATGRLHQVPPSLAAAADGLLPTFLAAGEVVWRAATGRSLGVQQVRDPDSLLGYRVKGAGGAPFSVVMLSVIEASERAARPEALVVNELGRLWRELPPHRSDLPCGRLPMPRAGAPSP
ncbi:hypothetical protein GXW71_09860 [Roseomonas hellenica]|uniref:Uncharacterized protein n=1 Tax=Plastoroseomonas hellenica TaxID=2687306 RepID=A0ABS5EWH7_9PROT|nr:hypothetical protein [Plastoroseomonas hellenica]MBR0664656.1 hypothetical protein [Plastoroseomonas hellenica]